MTAKIDNACIGNIDQDCDRPVVWVRKTQFAGDHPFCDVHARREKDFGEDSSTVVWHQIDRIDLNSFTWNADKPFSVKEMLDKAHAASDARGTASVHEPVNHHTREPSQPTFAIIVEGEVIVDHLDDAKNTEYHARLDRVGPGQVEFTLIIDGRVCGKLPFDNLVKAATRIDPDHATGSEKQIRALRHEAADALAKMYDWQARATQLEEKVHTLEAALETAHNARP